MSKIRVFARFVVAYWLFCVQFTTSSSKEARLPPIITNGPFGQVIYKVGGSPIFIPCEATGAPTPTEYEWFKNGAPFPLTNHNVQRHDSNLGSITLDKPTAIDQGYYQCTAKNKWGKVRSDVVQLIAASLDDYISTSTKTVTVNEGDYLMLPCEQTRAVPNATYKWFTTSSETDSSQRQITLDSRINKDENGNLHFAFVRKSDHHNGIIYKCNVENKFLEKQINGSYVQINVQSKKVELVKPALRHSSATNVIGIKGKDVSFRCIFSGVQVPKVTREKLSGTLPSERISLINSDTELRIKNLALADQGVYQCTGSNKAGSASTTFTLQVQVIPEFLKVDDSPHNIDVTAGNDAVVHCRANAEPASEVTWYINGERFNGDNNRRRISQDGKSLSLLKLCRDCADGTSDLMIVSCNASNVHGYTYASGYINVLSA